MKLKAFGNVNFVYMTSFTFLTKLAVYIIRNRNNQTLFIATRSRGGVGGGGGTLIFSYIHRLGLFFNIFFWVFNNAAPGSVILK